MAAQSTGSGAVSAVASVVASEPPPSGRPASVRGPASSTRPATFCTTQRCTHEICSRERNEICGMRSPHPTPCWPLIFSRRKLSSGLSGSIRSNSSQMLEGAPRSRSKTPSETRSSSPPGSAPSWQALLPHCVAKSSGASKSSSSQGGRRGKSSGLSMLPGQPEPSKAGRKNTSA